MPDIVLPCVRAGQEENEVVLFSLPELLLNSMNQRSTDSDLNPKSRIALVLWRVIYFKFIKESIADLFTFSAY